MAIVISLLTVGFMYAFKIEINTSIYLFWALQACLMLSFLSLSQIFVMLLGNSGMVFNIMFTAMQLVSSGGDRLAWVITDILWKNRTIFPATYGVNSYFTLIFGGEKDMSNVKIILLLSGIFLLIAFFSHQLYHYVVRKRMNKQTT